MYATICKQFLFHASHQLPNHDGPCRNLHGHTYRLEVIITDRVRATDGASDEGMVLDFGVLKDIYARVVEPYVEHQHLNDSLPLKVPTSEMIATDIWMRFAHELKLDDHYPPARLTIRLWESPTSFAEVGPTPWRAGE